MHTGVLEWFDIAMWSAYLDGSKPTGDILCFAVIAMW